MLPSRFLINLTTIITLATSICFLPNGTSHDDQGTQPCSLDPSSPLHNTCCHSKWENAAGGDLKFGQPKDECLPNGLCQNRGFSTKEGAEAAPWTHFYRVYCTNKDWEGCLSVCDTGVSFIVALSFRFRGVVLIHFLAQRTRRRSTHALRRHCHFRKMVLRRHDELLLGRQRAQGCSYPAQPDRSFDRRVQEL